MQEIQSLTGYFCEDFLSGKIWRLLWLRKTENQLSTWHTKSHKTLDCEIKTSMPSPIPIKRYCQEICSSLRRPETVQEIRKKVIFLGKINKLIICNFLKDFANLRKKTKRVVVFNCRSLPNIPKYRDHIWNLPTIWKIRLLQTHIK